MRRHFFWRSNNVGVYDPKGHFFRQMPKGSIKGVPDINVVDDTGHYIGIEVKAKKGIQSPDQKLFEQRCKENGAEYLLVRSVDEVIENGL